MQYVNVAIPCPLRTAFTYAVPEGMRLLPGQRVRVAFHRRPAVGIVLEEARHLPEGLDPARVKPIEGLLDEAPALAPKLLELVRWMAGYYCAPVGEVCRAALPARLLQVKPARTTRPALPHEMEPLHAEPVVLTAAQEAAFTAIAAGAHDAKPPVFLLHGVTGSGKTEIYLRLFEALAKEGRQGLLLVPEIGLTTQLAGRAASRLGERVAVYHSGLTDAQRHAQWQRMQAGGIDVVIGTRSALFAPFPALGAIVVDEEHDSSYKQDEGLTYHGRDAAVMRAHLERVVAVLGSATPSIESLANAQAGKYRLCELPARAGAASMPSIEIVDLRPARHASGAMNVTCSRGEAGGASEGQRRRRELQSLSPALYDAIEATLASGEQVLLYLGKRGFAGAVHCEACGEVFRCPNCDIALTAHVARDDPASHASRAVNPTCSRGEAGGGAQLLCHYCDYRIAQPTRCAACGSEEIVPVGQGTQRLEAEIADFFPEARVARLDSDTAASPKERRRILSGMRRRQIDILIGTQMITKGHDFPHITLVGVVSADLSLHLPDFRAAERTFQLITQVAGRAGRGAAPGRVIIQTYEPAHPSLVAASEGACGRFAEHELGVRRELSYPPFARLAVVRLSALKRDLVEKAAGEAAEAARQAVAAAGRGPARHASGAMNVTCSRGEAGGAFQVLGPAPAPLTRLRGRYRFQLLIKAPSTGGLTRLLASLHPRLDAATPRAVRLAIDVDPVNLL